MKRGEIWQNLWLFMALCLFLSAQSYADEAGQVGTGELRWHQKDGSYRPATLLSTAVDVSISGLMVQGTLRQTFQNDSDQWREATYVFPLPEDAAVYSMKMQVGDREIVGEIKEKQAARRTYQKAKAAGKRVALVDQQRPNLFTSNVANIDPGATIEVVLQFSGQVRYVDGRFEWRFPLTSTPRYVPGGAITTTESPSTISVAGAGWAVATDQVPDAAEISPFTVPLSALKPRSHQAKVSVTIDAGLPLASIESVSHDLKYEASDSTAYRVTLGENGLLVMDKDLLLQWHPKPSQQPRAAAFQASDENGVYSMVMLMPPEVAAEEMILPRTLILVVDTSGSMAGESIVQARASVQKALDSLRPNDRFNLIEFNSRSHVLYTQPVVASEEHVQKARQYANQLVADGGTEMALALDLALQQSAQPGYVQQVVFITDGSVANEQALFAQIERNLKNARLFTVGIGSAPNRYFMRKAAAAGRGRDLYISDVSSVESRLGEFLQALEKPVLSDIRFSFDVESDAMPAEVRDLYIGEPLIIISQHDQAPSRFSVEAFQVGAVSTDFPLWSKTIDMTSTGTGVGLGRYWARQKIEHYLDSKVLGVVETEIRSKVLPLALNYQLVSPYTSFIAVDNTPARPGNERLSKESIPQLLPAGSSMAMARFPQTATSSYAAIRNGSLGLLFLAFLVVWQWRQNRLNGRDVPC